MTESDSASHSRTAWDRLAAHVDQVLQRTGAHPSRTQVLLPLAQWVPLARQAWGLRRQAQPDSPAPPQAAAWWMPRFETTAQWAQRLGFEPGAQDIHFDAARDRVQACLLLEQAGLAGQREILADLLVQLAWQLAPVARALAPSQRMPWAQRLGGSPSASLMDWEEAVQRMALAWAATSAYASDTLWQVQPDALVVVSAPEGNLTAGGSWSDPLAQALLAWHGERASRWCLPSLGPDSAVPAERVGLKAVQVRTHALADADEEAEQATACVLAHLQAGRVPVALVAQDRALTRQVHARLQVQGIPVQDETGWTLSTTRAAARLMSLLQALDPQASADTLLDALKQCPAVPQDVVSALEQQAQLQRQGWKLQPTNSAAASPDAMQAVQQARLRLRTPRPLQEWLTELVALMSLLGLSQALAADEAGALVLRALHLDRPQPLHSLGWTRPIARPEFCAWVHAVLEASRFVPSSRPNAPVLILPLVHLPLRPFAAAVIAGCDEQHLNANPQPAGPWTPAQRAALGLPQAEDLARALRAAWQAALGLPWVDLLWRCSDGGEEQLPSALVRAWLLEHVSAGAGAQAVSAELGETGDVGEPLRVWRTLTPQPVQRPAPAAPDLLPTRISASTYEDLRRCPYRFFALRLLGLREEPELEADQGKREFGVWLHALLHRFHQLLAQEPSADAPRREALMAQAMHQVDSEATTRPPEWLAFEAAWPRVGRAYLEWLRKHEAQGFAYQAGEVRLEQPLGRWTLVGQIDRIDRQPDGTRLVLDYKSESATRTSARVKSPLEDTQIVFYAALLGDAELGAAYVNLSEQEGKSFYPQPHVQSAREALRQGLVNDLERVAGGASLPALGEGEACEFCAARGLCRKDFWWPSGAPPDEGP